MIDLRCWECADIDKDNGNLKEIQQTDYQGKGIFKCPKCNEILDYSKDVYVVKVLYSIENGLEIVSGIEDKEKLDEISQNLNDMGDNYFKDGPEGLYNCEIITFSYQCGGEEPEWDSDLIIPMLKKEEL